VISTVGIRTDKKKKAIKFKSEKVKIYVGIFITGVWEGGGRGYGILSLPKSNFLT
jgi:hypothetical protein